MEIKKRLGKIQKRLTPFIEQMNINVEMNRLCKRFEELVEYGEAKEVKHIEREKTGMSQSMRIDAQRRKTAAEIQTIYSAEVEEALADQQQAKAEIDPRKTETPPKKTKRRTKKNAG